MHFLRINAAFYNAVNMIQYVITTANPFPYTANFMFIGVRNSTSQMFKDKQNTYSVGRNDNFLAKTRKLSIFPTSLDIFDIQQHYIHILYFSVTTSTKQVIRKSWIHKICFVCKRQVFEVELFLDTEKLFAFFVKLKSLRRAQRESDQNLMLSYQLLNFHVFTRINLRGHQQEKKI